MENPTLWWQKVKVAGGPAVGAEEKISDPCVVGGRGSGVASSRFIYTPADRLMDGSACWACGALTGPRTQLVSPERLFPSPPLRHS